MLPGWSKLLGPSSKRSPARLCQPPPKKPWFFGLHFLWCIKNPSKTRILKKNKTGNLTLPCVFLGLAHHCWSAKHMLYCIADQCFWVTDTTADSTSGIPLGEIATHLRREPVSIGWRWHNFRACLSIYHLKSYQAGQRC